jgi:hypothetical protein
MHVVHLHKIHIIIHQIATMNMVFFAIATMLNHLACLSFISNIRLRLRIGLGLAS